MSVQRKYNIMHRHHHQDINRGLMQYRRTEGQKEGERKQTKRYT
jgi:hypothetical protein